MKDIRTVGHPLIPGYYYGSYPYGLTDVEGTLFFSAVDDTHRKELWRSDGTEEGTVLVKDINAAAPLCAYLDLDIPNECRESIKFPVAVEGTLYFSADDGLHARELWKSDGTEEGTVMVKDIAPGGDFLREASRPVKMNTQPAAGPPVPGSSVRVLVAVRTPALSM